MKHLLAIVILLQCEYALGAFERLPGGARSAGMGNSVVATRGIEWSMFSNPGGLHSVAQRTAAFSYSPQPFGLKELAHSGAVYVEPTSLGAFSIAASRFGFELYRETVIGVGYATSVATGVDVGVALNYFSLSIQNYGSASSIGVDVGLQLDLSDDVRWGFSARNINAPTIGAARERLPQVFVAGLSYEPFRSALLTASITKDVRHAAMVGIGVEYTILQIISLRAGSISDPGIINAGLGVRYGLFSIDYSFSSHTDLGATHNFSLSLTLGEF